MKKFRFGKRSPRNDAFCVLFFRPSRVKSILSRPFSFLLGVSCVSLSLSLSLSLSFVCVLGRRMTDKKDKKDEKKDQKNKKKAKKERKKRRRGAFRPHTKLLLPENRLVFIIILFVVAKKARRGKWSSIGETEERETHTHTQRENYK